MKQAANDDELRFEEDGYLLKRRLVEPQILAGVIRRIEDVVDRKAHELKNAGQITDLHASAPFEQRWALIVRDSGGKQELRSWDEDVVSPELFKLLSEPSILDVVQLFVGPEVLATGMIAVRPKIPLDKRTTILWHQDSHYVGEDTAMSPIITVWLPLCDTNIDNGCLQMIRGSHKWGLEPCEWDDEHSAHRPVRDPTDRGVIVDCEMQAGDALFFNNLTYHRSGMNQSDHIRWSIDLRYHTPDLEYENRDLFMPGFLAHTTTGGRDIDTWESWQRRIDAHAAKQHT